MSNILKPNIKHLKKINCLCANKDFIIYLYKDKHNYFLKIKTLIGLRVDYLIKSNYLINISIFNLYLFINKKIYLYDMLPEKLWEFDDTYYETEFDNMVICDTKFLIKKIIFKTSPFEFDTYYVPFLSKKLNKILRKQKIYNLIKNN